MKYSLADTAWKRVSARVRAEVAALRQADGDSPRHMLRIWYDALRAEDCYRPGRHDWFEAFFLWARRNEDEHKNLALTLSAAICWEWQEAHRVAMAFRDSIRVLASWSPENEPRRWFDCDAVHEDQPPSE